MTNVGSDCMPPLERVAGHLILVDDDSSILHDYEKGLRLFCREIPRFEITCCEDAIDAIKRCAMLPDETDLIVIVDSMLPYGELFTEEETESGQLTGVAVIRRVLQQRGSSTHTQFIMLTNYERTELSTRLDDLEVPVKLCPKIKYSPRKFAAVVDALIAKSKG